MTDTVSPLIFVILGLLAVAGIIAQTPLGAPLKGYSVLLQSLATSHPWLALAAVVMVGLLLGVAAILVDRLLFALSKRRSVERQ
ncbi:hypothetical protein [Paraburkholderia sp. SIMBA_054]|uniref:hypothetical protein n=1 Tax=Paraburkholderia sp. SIMBA_054 TaxID=3085795 RepID=UPI00397986FC